MNECKIVEDLLPLYEEQLVQEETRIWIETHLATCKKCQEKANIELEQLPPIAKAEITADTTIARTKLKLSIYQIFIVALSFIFAMNTTLFTNTFEFMLSYFVLGAVTYYFYRSWLLSLLLAFLPVFIWFIYDTIISFGSISQWMSESLTLAETKLQVILNTISGGVFVGTIHTLFACLGVLTVYLIILAFQEGDKKK